MTKHTEEKQQVTRTEWTPNIPEPGPETKALARFLWNGTWEGTVEPGGMGPGSPAMDATGRATCTGIMNGLWMACNFEQDQFVAGKKVLTWKAHWIIGWDRASREYRAVGVDSNGVAFIFNGRIEGNLLIMESMGDSPVKLRFTWDGANPDAFTWKNEMSVNKGPWKLIEQYTLHRESPIQR